MRDTLRPRPYCPLVLAKHHVHEREPQQVCRRGHRLMPRKERSAAHWLDLLLQEELGMHVFPRTSTETQSDVNVALVQVDVAVRGRDAHLDLRMSPTKRSQTRYEPANCEHRHRSDGDAPLRVAAEHGHRAAHDFGQRRRDCSEVGTPGIGELQLASAMSQQLHVEIILKCAELMT